MPIKDLDPKEVKNIKVKVTYEVGLGGLKITQLQFTQLKRIFENYKELDGMGFDEVNEAREWLNTNICENDCCEISYEIQELE